MFSNYTIKGTNYFNSIVIKVQFWTQHQFTRSAVQFTAVQFTRSANQFKETALILNSLSFLVYSSPFVFLLLLFSFSLLTVNQSQNVLILFLYKICIICSWAAYVVSVDLIDLTILAFHTRW